MKKPMRALTQDDLVKSKYLGGVNRGYVLIYTIIVNVQTRVATSIVQIAALTLNSMITYCKFY